MHPRLFLLIWLSCCLSVCPALFPPPAEEPVLVARTLAGKEVRGPLSKLTTGFDLQLGTRVRKSVSGSELLSVRQSGQPLPPLPVDEHLVLVNGDRIPMFEPRLADEKFQFHHPDLNGNKPVTLGLTAIALIWRLAPDGEVNPERLRHQLLQSNRPRDLVLLRNGDRLEGTLSQINDREIEIEVNKKLVKPRWPQVSVIALSTELADRTPLAGLHARAVVAPVEGSPGGRFTLTEATSDGVHFVGKLPSGARLRVPIERLVALEMVSPRIADLADLKPLSYTFTPYLDTQWKWSRNANVLGEDLRLEGGVFVRGVGMHATSVLRYPVADYKRFEALVGLDDRAGRKGMVKLRILLDGKPADLGKREVLLHDEGPLRVSLDLAGAKELTLEVATTSRGPVQAVVNWVEARLVR